jgi:hypothetical protein
MADLDKEIIELKTSDLKKLLEQTFARQLRAFEEGLLEGMSRTALGSTEVGGSVTEFVSCALPVLNGIDDIEAFCRRLYSIWQVPYEEIVAIKQEQVASWMRRAHRSLAELPEFAEKWQKDSLRRLKTFVSDDLLTPFQEILKLLQKRLPEFNEEFSRVLEGNPLQTRELAARLGTVVAIGVVRRDISAFEKNAKAMLSQLDGVEEFESAMKRAQITPKLLEPLRKVLLQSTFVLATQTLRAVERELALALVDTELLTEFIKNLALLKDRVLWQYRNAGIQAIAPSLNDRYDPARHQLIWARYDASVGEGCIIELIRRGYERKGGELIQRALVVVSRRTKGSEENRK